MIFFKFFDGEVGEREEFEKRSGERKRRRWRGLLENFGQLEKK